MSDSNYDLIWSMYGGICCLCLGKAASVHEILPRSSIPNDWMAVDNRVLLCASCHNKVQENPSAWKDKLILSRDYLLEVMGE
jgi:5-methylcytosine-specific restriction endonuclease McrA